MPVRRFIVCLALIAAAAAPLGAQTPAPVRVPPPTAIPAIRPPLINPSLTPTLITPPDLAPMPVPVPPPPKKRQRFIVCPGNPRCPRSH